MGKQEPGHVGRWGQVVGEANGGRGQGQWGVPGARREAPRGGGPGLGSPHRALRSAWAVPGKGLAGAVQAAAGGGRAGPGAESGAAAAAGGRRGPGRGPCCGARGEQSKWPSALRKGLALGPHRPAAAAGDPRGERGQFEKPGPAPAPASGPGRPEREPSRHLQNDPRAARAPSGRCLLPLP